MAFRQDPLDSPKPLWEDVLLRACLEKITTYPRTGSRYISEDVFEEVPILLRKVGMPLSNPLNRHSVDNTKVTDHHAIIPTGEAPLGLSTDETTIYQMVANRFIEAFPPIQRESVCRYGLRTAPIPLLGRHADRFPWDGKPCRSPVLYTVAQNADSRVSASMPRSYKRGMKW